MANRLITVPIGMVKENPIALRSVNKKSEMYPGLVDSIRMVGILSPPTVREMKDPETGQKYYSLVDGLHRLNAAQDAGLTEIPVHVITADDAAILEIQLMANLHKIETKPVEYSDQLSRILANNPTMTVNELATRLGISATWLSARLNLVKLVEAIKPLVEEGKITVANAIHLAKLPPEEQPHFVERAMTMPSSEFTPCATQRVKELRDAKREGRAAGPQEFVPVAHVRKLSEIKVELESPTEIIAQVREAGLRTPAEIVQATLSWVIKLDPTSRAAAKAKSDAHEADQKEKAAARKKEAAEKKQAAAALAESTVKAVMLEA